MAPANKQHNMPARKLAESGGCLVAWLTYQEGDMYKHGVALVVHTY